MTTATKLCACGCGETIPARDAKRRRRNFVPGHHMRGSGRRREREDANKTTKHKTARNRKAEVTECELRHIGGCLGRLDVNHIDKDPWNNADENLIKLCRAHHTLVDRGRIDLANPLMPAFYVDGSGKRRYAKS